MQCDLCGKEFSKKDNFEVEFKFDNHVVVQNICPKCKPCFDLEAGIKFTSKELWKRVNEVI